MDMTFWEIFLLTIEVVGAVFLAGIVLWGTACLMIVVVPDLLFDLSDYIWRKREERRRKKP